MGTLIYHGGLAYHFARAQFGEVEGSGFGPGDFVLVERDSTGEIRMLRAGDIKGRIDTLADEMVDKHAKALKILADHDAAPE